MMVVVVVVRGSFMRVVMPETVWHLASPLTSIDVKGGGD